MELKATGGHNALLSGPLDLRKGVSLVVDAGVTLFASRDPRAFDITPDITPGVCGTVSKGGARGCRPLISGNQVEGAGVLGRGAGNQMGTIDGRGERSCWARMSPGGIWRSRLAREGSKIISACWF